MEGKVPRSTDNVPLQERYAAEIAGAIAVQKRIEAEERARKGERPHTYELKFTCYPSTFEDIKSYINSHPTWMRSYRFYPGSDPPSAQERLPLKGGDKP